MKIRLIAFLCAVCMILSACGSTQSSVSTPSADTNAVSEAAASQISAEPAPEVESAAVPDEAVTPDTSSPEALGRWLWEQDIEESYAIDLDMEVGVTVDVNGENVTEQMTTRIKEITHEDGSITAQTTIEVNNVVSEVWFDNNTVYYSDANGNYKSAMKQEDYLKEYLGEAEGMADFKDLTADDLGLLTGEETSRGYKITYGQISVDAWSAFSSVLDAALRDISGVEFTYELRSVEGTIELDHDMNLLGQTMVMDVALNVAGVEVLERVELMQSVNCQGDSVSIHVPTEDTSYKEISDVTIPSLFRNGYVSLLSQPGIQYKNAMALTLSDGEVTEIIACDDEVYLVSGADGISYRWDTVTSYNGQILDYSKDVFSNGEGVFSDYTGEYPYTYDDNSALEVILTFISAYSDALDYGTDFTISEENGLKKLIITLDPTAYCEPVLDSTLQTQAGLSTADAIELSTEGTATCWFNETGILVAQLIDINATITLAGGTIDVTFMDGGDVLALNENVLIPAE